MMNHTKKPIGLFLIIIYAVMFSIVVYAVMQILLSYLSHAPVIDEKRFEFLAEASTQTFNLPLNNPPVGSGKEVKYMRPDDIVIGLVVNNIPRAYPWWYIHNYHVVNDMFGISGDETNSEYIALFLCDRCAGVSAYFREIADELKKQYTSFFPCWNRFHDWGTFEVCDTATRSSWHPFRGESVDGSLMGKRLERIPVQYMKWSDWLTSYPDTTITYGSPELRYRDHNPEREMSPNEHSTFGRVKDKRLKKYELVFGLATKNNDFGQAYSLQFLKSQKVHYDKLNDRNIVLLASGDYSVLAFYSDGEDIDLSSLEIVSEFPLQFSDDSKTVWNSNGVGISGKHKGRTLEVVDGYLSKWFEYSRFYEKKELDVTLTF